MFEGARRKGLNELDKGHKEAIDGSTVHTKRQEGQEIFLMK
jgi:hypothetical protein